jgi:tetratricopeptide (TPR) repeat protein
MADIPEQNRELLLAEFNALVRLRDEKEIFQRLSQLDPVFGSDINYQRNINGFLIDLGSDLKNGTLLRAAVKRLNTLVKEDPCDDYYYQLGNACNCLGFLQTGYPPPISLLIDCDEYVKARKYFSMVGSLDLFPHAMTNEANILDLYSRNYEALLLYDKVLKKVPEFGMAMGNKAVALIYFFNISATGNPEVILIARDLLKKALSLTNTSEVGGKESVRVFEGYLKSAEDFISRNQIPECPEDASSLYQDSEDLLFFKEHDLFLNFCFECRRCPSGFSDNIFPRLVERIHDQSVSEAMNFCGFSKRTYYCLKLLNHVLEDYSTARVLFYQAEKQDFGKLDDITRYVATLDFTRNGIRNGLLKTAFAKLYGILDKIAYWVYFFYDIVKDRIEFGDLLAPRVREIILAKKNYQLLALHSLARDFMDGGLYSNLRMKRNHIAHSFLDLGDFSDTASVEDDYYNSRFHSLDDFRKHVLLMFAITKGGVLYFLNALQRELRSEESSNSQIVPLIATQLQKDFH